MRKAIDADPGLHRFRKTNLFFVEDPYYLFQDPTILGFKLMFDFHGDGLLSKDKDNPNTALNYLMRIGQTDRAVLLNKFISHLEEINNKTPWFFQEITGLNEAWKRGFSEKEFSPLLPEDRKITISCLESIDLRITALLDLYRKSSFDWNFRRELIPWNLRHFNMYVYVYELRNINVTGLPSATDFVNLNSNISQQQQNLALLGQKRNIEKLGNVNSIVRNTLGNLKTLTKDTVAGLSNSINNKDKGKLVESSNTIDTNISRLMFYFKQCEFLPDESGDFLTKVDNKGGEAASQSIVFSYRNLEEINLNNIYVGDMKIQDSLIRVLDSSAFDVVEESKLGLDSKSYGLQTALNPFQNLINPIAQLGASTVEKFAKNAIGRALLGNVYGIQPAQLLSSIGNVLNGNPAEALTGLNNTIRQGSNTYTNIRNSIRGRDTESIGNAYDLTGVNSNQGDVDSIGNVY